MNGLFQEGVAHQNAGHFEEALRLFQRVARELERGGVMDASIYAAIGYAHLLLGDHKEALEFSKKALEIDANFAKALVNASAACRLLNRLDEAYSYAEKAHELEP